MRKHFVSISDAKKIIFREFSLLDEDLLVKKSNNDGTFSLDPIITAGSHSKDNVDEFATECKSKGKELLVEVNPQNLGDTNFSNINILTFDKLENETYHEVVADFEPRRVQLLEFDVAKELKFSPDSYKTVVLLPSKIDKNSLFLSEKSSVIRVGENFTARREALSTSRLGSDLYLLPKSSELLDEYNSWLVEIEEVDKDVYQMRKRNYFFIKPIPDDELPFLSPEELKIYKTEIAKKSEFFVIPQEEKEMVGSLIQINNSVLIPLLANGIENMPFKDIIEVYNQEGAELVRTTLEKALNYQGKKIK